MSLFLIHFKYLLLLNQVDATLIVCKHTNDYAAILQRQMTFADRKLPPLYRKASKMEVI